jgi:hypothetical protein
MTCRNCGSKNILIEFVQNKTNRLRKPSVSAILVRWFVIYMTLGLWLLVERKPKAPVKIRGHREACCQRCGAAWRLAPERG